MCSPGTPSSRCSATCPTSAWSISARRATRWHGPRPPNSATKHSSGDWRKVVADPEVDVVSIITPNRFHLEMATAAPAAGKHVWCEKPMAPSLADAEEMLAAARVANRIACSATTISRTRSSAHIQQLMRDGAIGTVNHVRIEMDEDFMADPKRRSSSATRRRTAAARSTISRCIRCRCC